MLINILYEYLVTVSTFFYQKYGKKLIIIFVFVIKKHIFAMNKEQKL